MRASTTAGGAARQETLREHNLALVARTVLTAATPLSRAEVATRTGLNRATVSRLVTELVAGRLVVEDEPVAGRAGRPATPLRPAPRTVAGLGLEVSIDYLGARLVDLTGTVLAEEIVRGDLRGSDPAATLGELGRLGRGLVAGAGGVRLAGTGLAVPGLVRGTMLLTAPNLGWSDVAPGELLGHPAPGGRLTLGNEARFAARAELAAAGDGARSFLYVSGDVGIGAAIVHDGVFFGGQHGWSGELGHVCVDPAGRRCRCGAVGCLETLAGIDALLRRAGLPEGTGADALLVALDGGDGAARTAVEEAALALATALGGFVNLVDVSAVVLGNTLAQLAGHLMPTLSTELTTRVLAAPWAPPVVRAAVAGAHPALSGAARAALAPVVEDPSSWLADADASPQHLS